MSAAGRLTNGRVILMHDQYATTLLGDPAHRGRPEVPWPVRRHDLAPDRPCGRPRRRQHHRRWHDHDRRRRPTSTGGGNGCQVTFYKDETWDDRFNVKFDVTGSSNWTVNVGLGSGQTVQSSWDANVSGTSGNLTPVTPTGGNSFGITLFSNENTALPTASCTAAEVAPAPATGPTSTGGGNPAGTLAAAAAKSNRYFGFALSPNKLNDSTYSGIGNREFSMVTRRERDEDRRDRAQPRSVPSFTNGDRVYDWATQNGKRVRGPAPWPGTPSSRAGCSRWRVRPSVTRWSATSTA
ncbi:MAG: cellulose binding domain-containing protein [Kineosporiaceae bacterium]